MFFNVCHLFWCTCLCVIILPRRRFDLLLIQLLKLAKGRLIWLVATAVSAAARLLASRHCSRKNNRLNHCYCK